MKLSQILFHHLDGLMHHLGNSPGPNVVARACCPFHCGVPRPEGRDEPPCGRAGCCPRFGRSMPHAYEAMVPAIFRPQTGSASHLLYASSTSPGSGTVVGSRIPCASGGEPHGARPFAASRKSLQARRHVVDTESYSPWELYLA